VIDFHCHIDLYDDPVAVVRECASRHISVLSVTNTPSAWERSSELAAEATRIQTALGLHPQLAAQRKSEIPLFERLLPRARYVGEVGLDGSPACKGYWSDQVAVFQQILVLCERAGGRVLSVHSRLSVSHVLDLLEMHLSAGTAVLHWFSGTQAELSRAAKLGCWFSVNPTMLATAKGRQIAAQIPRDRILTESDGPFARIGGRPALPWDTRDALSILAELWDESPLEVERTLHENLRVLVSPFDGRANRL